MKVNGKQIMSVPKDAYVAALRERASVEALGSNLSIPELETPRTAINAPNPARALVLYLTADTIEKAPGDTTEEVYEIARAGYQRSWGVFRLVKRFSTASSFVTFLFLLLAGALGGLGAAVVALILKLGANLLAKASAGRVKRYWDVMHSVRRSSHDETIRYGSRAILAAAHGA